MSTINTIPTWEELQTSYKKFGYSDSTIERDRRTYLGFIRDYCQKSTGESGIEVVTNAIAAAKDDLQNGLIPRNRYIRLRRVSAKIICQINKGGLEWMNLGPIDKKYASDSNEELLRQFLQRDQECHAPAINYRSELIAKQFLIYN